MRLLYFLSNATNHSLPSLLLSDMYDYFSKQKTTMKKIILEKSLSIWLGGQLPLLPPGCYTTLLRAWFYTKNIYAAAWFHYYIYKVSFILQWNKKLTFRPFHPHFILYFLIAWLNPMRTIRYAVFWLPFWERQWR